jgi:predicted amidohydrolase
MSIAVCQPQCVSYDVETNAHMHAEMIGSAGARVVVFPEMSLTGYELDADAVAMYDPRLGSVVEACFEMRSIALIGAPVHGKSQQLHIGMLAVDDTGVRVVYHKMWLGGDEPMRFSPGTRPAVLEVDGWRLGLAICKDSGVPQHAEATAASGIDVYIAGVLHHEEEAAMQEDRARRVAIGHGIWVATASFAGSTGGGFVRACGQSAIWSHDGVAVARAGSEAGRLARAVLSQESLPAPHRSP